MRKKVSEEMPRIKPIRKALFYGTHGLEIAGYLCGNIEIKRRNGETLEELRVRSRDSVQWPSIETRHVFIPTH